MLRAPPAPSGGSHPPHHEFSRSAPTRRHGSSIRPALRSSRVYITTTSPAARRREWAGREGKRGGEIMRIIGVIWEEAVREVPHVSHLLHVVSNRPQSRPPIAGAPLLWRPMNSPQKSAILPSQQQQQQQKIYRSVQEIKQFATKEQIVKGLLRPLLPPGAAGSALCVVDEEEVVEHGGVSDPRNGWRGFGCPLPPLFLPNVCHCSVGAGAALGQCVSWGRWEQQGGSGGAWGRALGRALLLALGRSTPGLQTHTVCVPLVQRVPLHQPSAGVLSRALVPAFAFSAPQPFPAMGWEQSSVPLTAIPQRAGKAQPSFTDSPGELRGAAPGGGKGGGGKEQEGMRKGHGATAAAPGQGELRRCPRSSAAARWEHILLHRKRAVEINSAGKTSSAGTAEQRMHTRVCVCVCVCRGYACAAVSTCVRASVCTAKLGRLGNLSSSFNCAALITGIIG